MRYLLFTLLLALAACNSPKSSSPVTTLVESEVVLYPRADGKPFFLSHKSKTALSDLTIGRVMLKGDSASRRLVLDRGIELKIFRDGVQFLKMSAAKAVSLPPYRELDFPGMTNFSLANLEAEMEKMNWKAGEPLVSTQDFVQLVGQNKIIEGRGMEASLDFEYYAIDKVTSVIDLGEAP